MPAATGENLRLHHPVDGRHFCGIMVYTAIIPHPAWPPFRSVYANDEAAAQHPLYGGATGIDPVAGRSDVSNGLNQSGNVQL